MGFNSDDGLSLYVPYKFECLHVYSNIYFINISSIFNFTWEFIVSYCVYIKFWLNIQQNVHLSNVVSKSRHFI